MQGPLGKYVFVAKMNLQVMQQIADFGMARDVEDNDYYVSHGGHIPVKWTAPEVYVYNVSTLDSRVDGTV